MGDSERGNAALYTANEMINIIQSNHNDAYKRYVHVSLYVWIIAPPNKLYYMLNI